MIHRIRFVTLMSLLWLAPTGMTWGFEFDSGPQRVTVIELYTSHGCSSCPPADRWLDKLADHPQLWTRLVPLAFHVDYWDDLGWPDRFASSAYTERQYHYRRLGGVRSIYTPGFVINGNEWRGWFRDPMLKPSPIETVGSLTLQGEAGSGLQVRFAPAAGTSQNVWSVQVAVLGAGLQSPIGGGENQGRTLAESFVVLGTRTAPAGGNLLAWEIDWPELVDHDSERLAVVAWVTRSGEQAPQQAVGGWVD